MGQLIRQAEAKDWPHIERWRAEHFERIGQLEKCPRPITGQKALHDAAWVVVERDGVVVAAASYTDDLVGQIKYAHDLYAEKDHVMDGFRLGKFIEQMCDFQGYELRAATDPENLHYINLLLKRGFEIVSVELKRRPKHERTSAVVE